MTRTDANVNFDWGMGSPAPAVNADHFSVRWTGQVQPLYTEAYTFYADVNDGARLWVNGQLIINQWNNTGEFASTPIYLMAGQKYDIRLEFHDVTDAAKAKLSWSSMSCQAKEIIPTSQLYMGQGTGLLGEYYTGTNFNSLDVTRPDPTVNFDWGTGSPDPLVPSDNFSVRWTGQVQPLYSENYTFYVNANDGARLWVNNQLVIDQWGSTGGEYAGTPIALVAGQKYDIRLDYYEDADTDAAAVTLSWSSASQTKQIIPTSQLYTGRGTGLVGEYYNTSIFSGLEVTQTDPTVNFLWNEEDGFVSERWSGQVQPLYSEIYTFYVGTDWEASLWIDGQLLLSGNNNNLGIGGETSGTTSVALVTGQKYDIRLDVRSGWQAKLSWSSASQTKEVIPAGQLYSAVSITSPGDDTVYNQSPNINITASASALPDTPLTQVAFYEDGNYLGFDNYGNDGWSYSWNSVPIGTHRLTAVVTTYYGATYASSPVCIRVNNPPTVNITAPAADAVFNSPANVTITANASDTDGTIASVAFYEDGNLLGTDTNGADGWSCLWSNATLGSHNLTAIATDNDSGVTTSDPVHIGVTPAAPTGLSEPPRRPRRST